jgi:hypothetical protein
MHNAPVKTHSDGIWISEPRETAVVSALAHSLKTRAVVHRSQDNFGYPTVYEGPVYCRVVDSVFLPNPDVASDAQAVIVTDNYPLVPVAGHLISVIPEFWSIWRFDPEYTDREPTKRFNCFMNRPRGDRNVVFYELIRRNLLDQGFVSYNCTPAELAHEYLAAELTRYSVEHLVAQVPYNTVDAHGTLEQCVIDSGISLIVETYIADDHVVFSEKIFRALQLPRPWVVYTSPGAVALLRRHGFDILDDYVDHSYDAIVEHSHRLIRVVDQLEQVLHWTDEDLLVFDLAAQHNRRLLQQWANDWPWRFTEIIKELESL